MNSAIRVIDAAGPPAPSGGWRRATVREVTHPTPHGVQLRLEVPDRVDHLPGQHYVIRLTAPDGYVAQRSFSIASAPFDPGIELFIERLDDGEVSTYLADVTLPGDQLEVRGPIGGWFVWRGDTPIAGVAGGTGVVPFVAMLRQATHLGRQGLLRLAVSTRTLADLPYADELVAQEALIAVTREEGEDGRPKGRLTAVEISALVAGRDPTCYVCGSAQFAEAASTLLLDVGTPADRIRIERFGPSG